jgi:hypothetical protein
MFFQSSFLLQDHIVVTLFLTMLVGAGGNAGNQSAIKVIRGLVSTITRLVFGADLTPLDLAGHRILHQMQLAPPRAKVLTLIPQFCCLIAHQWLLNQQESTLFA